MNPYLVKAAIVIGGGMLGYLYYKFIGCRTGACPLTSSPLMSTILGAGIALMLASR